MLWISFVSYRTKPTFSITYPIRVYLEICYFIFIEIIFYYHPAVWWISANIRTERENCCDDIAVKICGSSITYVKALVTLEEIQPTPNLAMSFSSGSKNQLLNRVKRILNQPQNKFNIMEKESPHKTW